MNGDSWLVAGTRGSGKTTFSRQLVGQLLALFPKSRLYVLDSKIAGDFEGWPGVIQTDGEAPGKPQSNQRVQVWQPVYIIAEEVEKWQDMILHDGPAILYVDEVVHLVYTPRNPSPLYAKILKVGRGLDVGTITCTQEVAGMPRQMVGQSSHIARFKLLDAYERRVIDNVMGVSQKTKEPIDQYGFYHFDIRTDTIAQYFTNAQEFFR